MFSGFHGVAPRLADYGVQLCKTVKQWTGIPISIGIAPTKTLAKLANRLAKKGHSANGQVLDWRTLADPGAVLATVALDDLWGISRRTAVKLQKLGIHNALDLSQADPKRLRQHLGVVMERIICELQGISCIPLEAMPPPGNKSSPHEVLAKSSPSLQTCGRRSAILPAVRRRNCAANNWQRA